MNRREALIYDRNTRRDEVAQRIADACQRYFRVVGAPTDRPIWPDVNVGNVFMVEDAAGTQYTVTVSRSRRQQEG
jgi:hypothetical protein